MMLCLQHGTARILLSGTCPNPAKSMAGAGFGRICHKRPDAGTAGAAAEIRYIPTLKSQSVYDRKQMQMQCSSLPIWTSMQAGRLAQSHTVTVPCQS